MKHGGIFERLLLAFGDAQDNNLRSFAEVVARRTNQVTDILDKEQVEMFQAPIGKRLLDHARIEMASSSSRDLLDRKAEARQADRVIIGLNISSKDRDALVARESFERTCQQSSLPSARRAHEIEAKDVVLRETVSQFSGNAIVLAQHFPFQGHAIHKSSISKYANSSSLPLKNVVSASPQAGHAVL